jgi:GT2 family glycosyltransferase
MSLEDRLASLTPSQRAICEAILARLPEVGDVNVEPVRVGFFLKHGSTFASLRLRRDGIRLLIMLPRRLDHPRLSSSRSSSSSGRMPHATTLHSTAEVDDDVVRWLAESFASSEL